MEGLSLFQTDRGVLQWTLSAASGDMREDEGTLGLASPKLRVFKDGRAAADVSADHGDYQEKTGDFQATGRVVAVSREERAILTTDELDYLASEGHFKTDRPVVIDRPNGRTRGTGLVANRDLSEIKILRQESNIQ